MEQEILKTKELLEKTEWQRKTYPFKLDLNPIQKDKIDVIILEYKKAINKAIEIVIKKVFPNFSLIMNEVDIKKDKCPLCKGTKQLNYILHDFKIEYYKIGDKEFSRVVSKKNAKNYVCNCFLGQSSTPHKIIRKFVLPSENRDILPDYDFTVFGNLYHKELIAGKGKRPSIYDSCLQKAMETIKSQIEINKKIDYKKIYFEKKILNKKDYLSSLIDNPKQNELSRYTANQILRFIKKDRGKIENLEKRKAKKIEYKQNSIRLYENSYRLINEKEDFFFELKNYMEGIWLRIRFFGKDYQKELSKEFIKTANCETELIHRNGDYYIQYIFKKELNLPIPDKTFTSAVVIIGLRNIILVYKNKKKISYVKLYNLNPIWRKRMQMDKIRKIWQKRRRLWKVKNSRNKEVNYVTYSLHNISTDIIQRIKSDIKKPVIIIADMKYIRDILTKNVKKIKKEDINIKKLKRFNWKINRWNFLQFQNMIKYKANWLGIPFIILKNDFNTCSKCKNKNEDYNIQNPIFKCEKCNYEINIGINSAVNLSKEFFNLNK